MSDNESQAGWNVTPRDYVRGRQRPYEGERLISEYVAVRDGTKLAVDIDLPGDIDEDKSYPRNSTFFQKIFVSIEFIILA